VTYGEGVCPVYSVDCEGQGTVEVDANGCGLLLGKTFPRPVGTHRDERTSKSRPARTHWYVASTVSRTVDLLVCSVS